MAGTLREEGDGTLDEEPDEGHRSSFEKKYWELVGKFAEEGST